MKTVKPKKYRITLSLNARQCENLKEYKNTKFIVIYKKYFATESIHTCTGIGNGLDANKYIEHTFPQAYVVECMVQQ